jgi:hypothetical protein
LKEFVVSRTVTATRGKHPEQYVSHYNPRGSRPIKRTLVSGIAASTRGKLTEYAEDVAVHYANKKREELLMAARDLMTADSVRYVLGENWFLSFFFNFPLNFDRLVVYARSLGILSKDS